MVDRLSPRRPVESFVAPTYACTRRQGLLGPGHPASELSGRHHSDGERAAAIKRRVVLPILAPIQARPPHVEVDVAGHPGDGVRLEGQAGMKNVCTMSWDLSTSRTVCPAGITISGAAPGDCATVPPPS